MVSTRRGCLWVEPLLIKHGVGHWGLPHKGTRLVVTETGHDLAIQGALCVSCEKWDAKAVLQSEEFCVPVEDGGGGSSHEPGPGAWDLVSWREMRSLCGLGHQGVRLDTHVWLWTGPPETPPFLMET